MLSPEQIEKYKELIYKETGQIVTISPNTSNFDNKLAEQLLEYINQENKRDIRRRSKSKGNNNLRAAFVYAVVSVFGESKNINKNIGILLRRNRTTIIKIRTNAKNWYPIYDDFKKQCDETYNYLITLKNTENGKANQNN